eukprot:CAMPEP_0172567520 /NCGR_PEP_ID=MMETSP1067-20121228/116146_1 /TAXON_ID=265564 ORGANISM="Thalassiosira punctigera, Strain Tpunct2005C2" /NCGR_SAMPLE_ID=MMETSP1067 /ASSEMBLY_ACC=CAM_ASM_000444 /LENGTH=388 /DNA_ID=CAMNT_0013358885 /DNA_START=54 /DNA_END=1220 /DNA_ORIENTATION=-
MASSGNDWCTIESDPGVFTSLIESFGTRNVEFAELWSLDDDSLMQLVRPMDGVDNATVHGLIFLFKWQSSGGGGEEAKDDVGRGKALVGEDCPAGLFFARQVTHNACATQAILSVLFNAPNSVAETDGEDNGGGDAADKNDDDKGRKLVLGKTLSNFKSFTSHFPPDLRGEAIGSSDEIRAAHNSFGRAEDAFLGDPTKPKRVATDDDDVFHFVAYVPHEEDGCVYELDGLQAGPIRVGSYRAEVGDENSNESSTSATGTGWMRVARDAIQDRLSNYSPTEIKFNLMAVVQDRRTYLAERLDSLASVGMEESDPAVLAVRSELHGEEEKRAGWRDENERRRHNYLPFCVEYLRCLAGSGRFEELAQKARERAGEKRKRAEERRKGSSK